MFGPHVTGVKYPNLRAPERSHQIVVCVGNGESLASDLVVERVRWGVAYGVGGEGVGSLFKFIFLF